MNLFIDLLMPFFVGFCLEIVLLVWIHPRMRITKFAYIILIIGAFSFIFYFLPTNIGMFFALFIVLTNIEKFEKMNKQ